MKKFVCAMALIVGMQGMTIASAYEQGNPTEVRVQLLEQSLVAHSSQQAIESWSQALKERNGAVQYAYLANPLRATYYFKMKELNWVTGGSSPWIDQYKITKEKKIGEHRFEFDLEFVVTNSSKETKKEKGKATVQLEQGKWVVSHIALDPGSSIGERTPYTSQSYIHTEEDYSIAMPTSWNGKLNITIDKENKRTGFVYKPQNRAKQDGALFGIERLSLHDWQEWGKETGMNTYLGEKNGTVYTLVKGSENPYANEPEQPEYEEFQQMLEHVREMTYSFSIK